MDGMEFKLNIDYYWKSDDGIDIPAAHLDALTEDAYSRIFEMVKSGCHQGELNTYVRLGKDIVPEEDEQDGLSYSGWWSAYT